MVMGASTISPARPASADRGPCKTLRVAVLLPLEHFHAPVILRALALAGDTEVLAVTTPKLTRFRGKPKSLRSLIRESGTGYLASMVGMKIWFQLRALLERARGEKFERRRFLSVRETIFRLGCRHVHFDRVEDPECLEAIREFSPELLLSVFFNQLVPGRLIRDLARAGGSFNVHPSPLPAYRGVSPAFWALSDGASTSGVTIHELKPEIDRGRPVARREFPISPGDTVFDLYRKSAEAAVESIENILDQVRQQGRPAHLPEPGGEASYRATITREAVRRLRKKGRRFFRWWGK